MKIWELIRNWLMLIWKIQCLEKRVSPYRLNTHHCQDSLSEFVILRSCFRTILIDCTYLMTMQRYAVISHLHYFSTLWNTLANISSQYSFRMLFIQLCCSFFLFSGCLLRCRKKEGTERSILLIATYSVDVKVHYDIC